mmetsp:Transcript_126970/g.206547  ORF Transcript_126970/g.206547 Transcript_126970/m.206547 type:complete len:104 (-) Transcript_126970:1037-1348(-)
MSVYFPERFGHTKPSSSSDVFGHLFPEARLCDEQLLARRLHTRETNILDPITGKKQPEETRHANDCEQSLNVRELTIAACCQCFGNLPAWNNCNVKMAEINVE